MGACVALVHIEPEPVPGRDGLDGDEQAGSIGVGQLEAVAVEALHPRECPAAVQLGRVLAGSLSGFGEQRRDRIPVADQGLSEGLTARGRLGASAEHGGRGDGLAAASVRSPMSPVSRSAQWVSSVQSRIGVPMPMFPSRAAKSWPTTFACSRSVLRQTTATLEPGWA